MRVCGFLAPLLPTKEGIYNLNNSVEKLDIDLIKVTLKPSVNRLIRRKAFSNGGTRWAEHCTVFSSVNMAILYEIPLIIWGEDIAVEFGGAQNKTSKPNAIDIEQRFDWLQNRGLLA